MHYALIADLIVFVHMLYVFFAVGGELVILAGGIFRWRWVRNMVFRFIHLGAVLLVAFESLFGILCPLTVWENRLRRLAGQNVEKDITFVGRIVRSIIFYDFPDWVFTFMYVGFGVLVILTLFLVRPRRKDGQ